MLASFLHVAATPGSLVEVRRAFIGLAFGLALAVRLDGPAGPSTASPAWATLDLLTAAIAQAADAVHLETPAAAGLPARTLAWGRENDIRPVTTTGDVSDTKVAPGTS